MYIINLGVYGDARWRKGGEEKKKWVRMERKGCRVKTKKGK